MAKRIPVTVSFETRLHRALKRRAASTNQTMSDIVNEAVRERLREDAIDLKALRQRRKEKTIPLEVVLKRLKRSGRT